MIKKRPDGKLVKDIGPYERIMPIIMSKRYDAMVSNELEIDLEKVDKFLQEKRKQGENYSYMHIIYAALIRTLKEKDKANRFIMNSRIYQREHIDISMAVKPKRSEDSEESTIKVRFTGNENLEEVKEKLNAIIFEIKGSENKDDSNVGTDKLAKVFNVLPQFLLKITVKFLMWLDKVNMLPKAIIEESPFHCSAFITNVGSIGLSSVFHHIYDFGTTGIFISIGKKKKGLKKVGDEIVEYKYLPIGIVIDERINDGYYFATIVKYITRLINNPEVLEKHYNEVSEEELEEKEVQRRKKKLFGRPEIMKSKALKKYLKNASKDPEKVIEKEQKRKKKSKWYNLSWIIDTFFSKDKISKEDIEKAEGIYDREEYDKMSKKLDSDDTYDMGRLLEKIYTEEKKHEENEKQKLRNQKEDGRDSNN